MDDRKVTGKDEFDFAYGVLRKSARDTMYELCESEVAEMHCVSPAILAAALLALLDKLHGYDVIGNRQSGRIDHIMRSKRYAKRYPQSDIPF